uniref:Uncharacterized protein LOC111104944 n=1 Tax=Crassostrea virginica TaxID=6565 RepID=A0A8B8AX16_CRAVI|nr:uncharacterized protein LOC111104944 [Crassostrea virginica]
MIVIQKLENSFITWRKQQESKTENTTSGHNISACPSNLQSNKSGAEAEEAGLSPSLEEDYSVTDTKIRQSEALYDTLLAEEASGAAKGEGEIELQLSEDKRRLKSEKMQEHLNRQMQQGGQAEEEESDLAHVPKVQYSQSIEEQALQKEQVSQASEVANGPLM